MELRCQLELGSWTVGNRPLLNEARGPAIGVQRISHATTRSNHRHRTCAMNIHYVSIGRLRRISLYTAMLNDGPGGYPAKLRRIVFDGQSRLHPNLLFPLLSLVYVLFRINNSRSGRMTEVSLYSFDICTICLPAVQVSRGTSRRPNLTI